MSTTTLPAKARPSEADQSVARESGERLAKLLIDSHDVRIQVGSSASVPLPESAVNLLLQGLSEIGKGNDVMLLPLHAELTTQEAAGVMNLSRPYVVRLLDEGRIPSHKVGTHRRVRLEDVIAYKRKSDAERLDALKSLVAEAQELDMGY